MILLKGAEEDPLSLTSFCNVALVPHYWYYQERQEQGGQASGKSAAGDVEGGLPGAVTCAIECT